MTDEITTSAQRMVEFETEIASLNELIQSLKMENASLKSEPHFQRLRQQSSNSESYHSEERIKDRLSHVQNTSGTLCRRCLANCY